MADLWQATHAENTYVLAVNGIDLHVIIGIAPRRSPRGRADPDMDRDNMFDGSWQWRERLKRIGDRLGRIPRRHLELLRDVPIIIAERLPSQSTSGGGWFPPSGAFGGVPASRWWGRDTGVTEAQLNAISHSRGIIGVAALTFMQRAPQGRYQGNVIYRSEFSVLHETGHCVDMHFSARPGIRYGGLHSRPPSAGYRGGQQPFQGQRYPHGPGWTPSTWRPTLEQPTYMDPRPRSYNSLMSEFAAESYSRLFLCPATICRGARGTPPCMGHSAACAGRIQTDLLHTPAFQALATPRSFLPNVAAAPAPAESRRGPEGQQPVATPAETPAVSPYALGGRPGPQQ